MRAIAVALALTVAAGPAAAQGSEGTGNAFYRICVDRDSEPLCVGIILGFMHGHGQALVEVGRQRMICMPPGSTPKQALDVVMREMRTRPQDRHKPLAELLAAALYPAFPCR